MLPLLLLAGLVGCTTQHADDAQKAPPAKVENPTKESELTTIKLTSEAEKRLGIVVAMVENQTVSRARTLAGEVVVPQDQTISVATPMAGTLHAPENGSAPAIGQFIKAGQPLFRLVPSIPPERDLHVQIEREIETARARVEAAQLKVKRAEQLVRDQAGSEKAAEQVREELAIAEADLKAARARLDRLMKNPLSADVAVLITAPKDGMVQKVNAVPGQLVAGATALFEIVSLSSVWIRVPVYVGELAQIDRRQPAKVHNLAGQPGGSARDVWPVAAPPSADPNAATADLYFQLPNGEGGLRPGQKVGVALALRTAEESLVVPVSAIVHDIHGGTWVYENTGPQTFVRRPVEVRYVVERLAVLGRGPSVGTKVVTVGAAELFGTEFGAGK
jgi:RND family efflux transporter MFP subunit